MVLDQAYLLEMVVFHQNMVVSLVALAVLVVLVVLGLVVFLGCLVGMVPPSRSMNWDYEATLRH